MTTSTIASNATENASSALAPAPSAAAETALIVVITCCDAFSTCKATAAFSVPENGLNVSGLTDAGNPKTLTTSAAEREDSCIIVVIGVTTSAPAGAFKVTLSSTSPDDVSIVVASVFATTEALELELRNENEPVLSVRVDCSAAPSCPSPSRSKNTNAF